MAARDAHALLLILALAGCERRGALPVVDGKVESCLACHGEVRGLGPSHDPRKVGCSPCHLGKPTERDEKAAHAGMPKVPGNLDQVFQTCGRAGCHDAIAGRVTTSMMASVRGMIAVDQWALGEKSVPDGTQVPSDLGASPADTHLKQLCVSCHLGTKKAAPAPMTELSRGGGCVACHLSDDPPRTPVHDDAARFVHPGLTRRIRDDACFGCHSRSARISLSYAGLRETDAATGITLQDGRHVERAPDDVHHARGMACIDCHTAQEAMGDGREHLHEEEATSIRCTTCHRTAPARVVATDAGIVLAEDRTGEVLANLQALERDIVVTGKVDGKRRVARPPVVACAGHGRVSCQACHAPWVPRCTGCHTQHDPSTKGWVEYATGASAGLPTLGVLVRDGAASIEPFAPGMVMTVNLPGAGGDGPLPKSAAALMRPSTRFLRAYAYAVPHTITREGRSCVSCHQDPIAAGYGSGRLVLVGGAWRFEPALAPSTFDGLPADAWVPFDREPKGARSTRTTTRPLSLDEQRRLLRVGACLACHAPGEPVYADFAKAMSRRTRSCGPTRP